MIGERLGVNMHIVTAAGASVRNHTAAVGRSHLEVEALVVSPYAAGLACLVEDEMDLGVTVIDMGGGTTTIGGVLRRQPDLRRRGAGRRRCMSPTTSPAACRPRSAHAERLKALFGSAISSTLDEREMIAVPQIGEEEDGHVNHVPKSLLVSIIAPRIEETFEMVRNRLEASGFDKIAGRRVVLTGGACQLHGVRELAGLILDKQVRIGRPTRINGLGRSRRTARLFRRPRGCCFSRFRSVPNRRDRRGSRGAGFSGVSGNGCARIFKFTWIFSLSAGTSLAATG